jgi:hypothetical protein
VNEVWRRPEESNGEMRTRRWTPFSAREVAVGEAALDAERGALDPGPLAGLVLEHLELVPLALGPAGVHPEEHLAPVLGLGAAGAGVDREDGVAVVVGAGEHPAQLEGLDGAAELLRLACDLVLEVGLGVLGLHLGEGLDVLLQPHEGGVVVHPRLLLGDLLLHLPRGLGVVPEGGVKAALLELG